MYYYVDARSPPLGVVDAMGPRGGDHGERVGEMSEQSGSIQHMRAATPVAVRTVFATGTADESCLRLRPAGRD